MSKMNQFRILIEIKMCIGSSCFRSSRLVPIQIVTLIIVAYYHIMELMVLDSYVIQRRRERIISMVDDNQILVHRYNTKIMMIIKNSISQSLRKQEQRHPMNKNQSPISPWLTHIKVSPLIVNEHLEARVLAENLPVTKENLSMFVELPPHFLLPPPLISAKVMLICKISEKRKKKIYYYQRSHHHSSIIKIWKAQFWLIMIRIT